ncbi:MAG: glycosyltransferase family 4 protein [Bacteroidota bacterium]|nr:glycosyltransferase family 4 protein [Bacteroidota bacterium]
MNKKILFIDHDAYNSGSTVSMNYLIEKFISEGNQVFVLTPKDYSNSKEYLNENIKITRFKSIFMKSFTLDLHFTENTSISSLQGWIKIIKNIIKFIVGLKFTFNTVKNIKPDLIYVNEYVVIQSSLVGYYLNIPTVIHVRSRFINGMFGIRRYLISRAIVKYNDLIFPITEQEKIQLYIKKHEENKVKVVGEFLNQKNFIIEKNINELKSSFMIPDKVKVVLMLGGILKIKGTLDFLQAAQKVIEVNQNVFFIIAGKEINNSLEEKKYFDNCILIINSEHNKKYFRWTGTINNPEELIFCSDILISPQTESHFSRPTIEAWALKKPVISYRNPHAENLINDKIDGLLIENGNYLELSKAILQLLNDQSYSSFLGSNGYKKTIKYYNSENTLNKIYNYCISIT